MEIFWDFEGDSPAIKEYAFNQFKEEYLPGLHEKFDDVEERAKAGYFLYGNGRDARVYQYDEYLKENNKTPLSNTLRVKLANGKGTDKERKAFEKAYKSTIPGLEKEKRLALMDKGREYYYKNFKPGRGKDEEGKKVFWGRQRGRNRTFSRMGCTMEA